MSDQYIGEIRWFPYVRGAPSGWLVCDGSLQSISGNETLYTLIGTIYGGDGESTFGLPDLRGRTPIHQGTGIGLTPRVIGQMSGSETVTLNTAQMPQHNHVLQATTTAAAAAAPKQLVPAALPSGAAMYATTIGANAINPMSQMFGVAGQGQPHDNCAPSLPILACIATEGVYPTRP